MLDGESGRQPWEHGQAAWGVPGSVGDATEHRPIATGPKTEINEPKRMRWLS